MVRRGGGLGFVLVVIVAAILLIVAARGWRSVAPTVQQIQGVTRSGASGSHDEDGSSAQAKENPDLQEMKRATDEHAKALEDASEASNQ